MKNLLSYIGIAGLALLLFSSCNSNNTADTILENDDMRTAIFEEIANDDQMMSDFMDVMMNNEHASTMMRGHEGMMNMMHDDKNMMADHMAMMKNMMSDTDKMGDFMQKMHKQGMMSKECLESTMAMMSEKDMEMNQAEAGSQ